MTYFLSQAAREQRKAAGKARIKGLKKLGKKGRDDKGRFSNKNI
jgi:hypothetical protein